MILGIEETERQIKWVQFQSGNNGGRGFWCFCAGHENDLVDEGINHMSSALNVNDDMVGCFLFFVFAFLITLLTSNQSFIAPHRMKWSYLQLCRMISSDWSNHVWNVCFSILFPPLSSLVFLLWWVNARSKRSLSSDIACQSRPENCSLKVTLLWCLHSVCHYTFHFLWAKIYKVSFDRRSKHL